MLGKIKEITNEKYFHIIMLVLILLVLIFTTGAIILRYNVEGETNMPFELSKISIISSSEGIDKEVVDTKWAFDVCQNNDIYIYIDKNSNYDRTEAIKSVQISNIKVESEKEREIKIYRPEKIEERVIFKNSEENEVKDLTYMGDMVSNLKETKISNQGGIIAFRCSNINVGEYTSNEEEINHHELLDKLEISDEDLNIKLIFDLTIELERGKTYKSTITLDLPVEGIIENGTTSVELTQSRDFIFKRVKNT